jgi:c-di-GMP-binding flagellar brake protein YcgR
MFPENRAERRYSCQVRVIGASTTSFEGVALDLSSSGVCLATNVPLEPGRQLHLEFDLPEGRCEALGEVRRATSGENGTLECGVRFVRISAEAQQLILQTLRRPPDAGNPMKLR